MRIQLRCLNASDVTDQVCNGKQWRFVCGPSRRAIIFFKTQDMPLSVSAHWPAHTQTLTYPTAFISGCLAAGQPLNPDALNETFCQSPAPVFPTNWASSPSARVWLYRQGRVRGERKLHNTAGCSLQHKWFIGQWEAGVKDQDTREWQLEGKKVQGGKKKKK